MRGIVLDVREVERPTGDEKLKHLRDLHLKIGDVDNPDDGYDVRIEGNWHNIEPNDAVSLLGHEPKGAARLSFPRLFINHCTGDYRRAYPPSARLTYGVLPVIERKYWLAAKSPASFAEKAQKCLGESCWSCCCPGCCCFRLAGLSRWFFLVLALLFSVPLVAALVLGGLYLRWLVDQPPFTWEEKSPPPLVVKNVTDYVNFTRQDFTPAYEKLAESLRQWAFQNPDADLDWVPVERGTHMIGKLQ